MNNSMRPQEPRNAKKYILFRPRVNQLVSAAAEHALVTVTAGTGYGKSQAVAGFLENSGISSIWLQLTGLDNYTTRFWDVFTQAMHTKNPELARQMAAMGFPDTMEKVYQFLRDFAQGVYRQGRCVLVLDDFHRIEDPAIINFVETLSFTNIENLTIVLITRYPLLIDYNTLQAEGLHANISVADLRFTPEEARQYFEETGLSFPENVMENVYSSTEGWPLALYLIGLHRRQKGALFNDPIECTIPLLYSLIEVEIFAGYPAEVQRVFIKLSLMESIPLDMVRVISGRLYADIVAHLRQNMFVQYNMQTEQYHFHRLFRLFLEEKQVVFSHDELARTHLAIGGWYEEKGNRIEALTYYQKCKNYAKIWNIIRRYGMATEIGEFCTGLLDSFPPEFLEANPECNVMRAHLVMRQGEIELAYQTYMAIKNEYESLALNEVRKRVLGETYIGLAFTSIMKGSYDFAGYYMKAYEYLPDGSTLLGPDQPYVGNNTALSLFGHEPGEVEKMVGLVFRVMPYATRVMNGCGFGVEYLIAAEAAFYQNQRQKAAEYAHQAIYHAQQKNQSDIVYNSFSILGRSAFAEGDYKASLEYLNQIREHAERMQQTPVFGIQDVAAGWFFAKVGRPDLVESWIATSTPLGKSTTVLLGGREKVVQAYVLLLKGEYYEMLALLDHMQELYERRNLQLLLQQMYVLKALCMYKIGDMAGSLESFLAAYEISYGNNLTMGFIEYGGDMCDLLSVQREGLEAYGDVDMQWVAALEKEAAQYEANRAEAVREYEQYTYARGGSLPALTENETRILEALCQGLSREEIATGFGVTLSMVKTTLKNIYSKIGAINRSDAIRIATESGFV